MQQYDSNTFLWLPSCFKRGKLHIHPRPNIAVDIVAIAT